jgi:hypothetical protein
MAEAVLIAETDPRTLLRLPQVSSESLPHVTVDLCTSAESLVRKLRQSAYDTIALNPLLIQDYRLMKPKQPFQLLTPVLVTASADQRPLAQGALETQAFGLIVKPIVPPRGGTSSPAGAVAQPVASIARLERPCCLAISGTYDDISSCTAGQGGVSEQVGRV